MKNTLFLATILLLVVSSTLAGRITPWADPDIVYPNSGKVSYMNLYFMLDTKLPAGHVMRVTLPFTTTIALNTSTTAYTSTIYTAASTSKGTYLSTAATSLTTAATPSFVKLSSSAPYTAYFYFSADLAASTPYVFKLVFSTSPTDTGFVGYVQMETMSPALTVSTTSTASDSPISYDLNNAFAPVQMFAAPGNITTFTITADSNSLVGGQSSVRLLTFLPTQNFVYWPLIQLSWDNTNFTISNLTSIDVGSNSSANTSLSYGSGTNQYWSTQTTTTLNIYHNQPLFTNQTVKYNFTTANPSGTTSSTINFSLKIMHRYNMNLTDVSTSSVAFTIANTSAPSSSSSTVTIGASVQILLSWGIDLAVTSLSGNSYLNKVFVPYSSPTANQQYQAMKFVFGTSSALSSATYKVTLSLCAAIANCDVLENSIVNSFTGSSCSVIIGTARSIACTGVSSVATSGNYIGGRIWFLGATTGTGVLTAAPSLPSGTTFSDSTIGTVTITVPANSSFSSITGTLNTTYNTVQYNYAPLANINGNGPMAALPYALLTPKGTNYTTIWTGSATDNTVIASTGAPTTFPTATTGQGGAAPNFGGIYGATSTNTKYNVALFTTGSMITNTASYRNTFTGTVGDGTTALTIAAGVNPGIDIFLNPNIYSSAGTTSAITSCYANNLPIKAATGANYWSAGADSATGTYTRTAHCFVNSVTASSQQYFRMRFVMTPETTAAIPIAASSGAAAIDAAPASNKYMTFFWENGFQINSSYAGASLKADSNVGDFYGVMYTISFLALTNNPLQSSSSSAADFGELSSSISNLAASTPIVVSTPFFWTQPIMSPLGEYALASTKTNYYQGVSAWIGGLTGAGASFTSNSLIWLLRLRGSLTTSTPDTGLYPTTGRICLFLQIPYNATANTNFEFLGGVNFTNVAGTVGAYNTAGGPLVGNGAVRCWNAGTVGNCLNDRTGRTLSSATYQPTGLTQATAGMVNIIDMYQIVSSDATYTSNFSIAWVAKPKTIATTANAQLWVYRLGFQSTSTSFYYIQSWDQYLGQGTYLSSGVSTTGTFPTLSTTAPTMFPASTSTACTVAPFSSSATTTPSIRLNPATSETDNTVITSTYLLVQAWTTAVNPAATNAAKQGGFVWCVQWNFKQASFSTTSSSLENSGVGDKCAAFDYMAYESSTYQNWYCLYCPIAATTALAINTGSAINMTLSNFYTGPAVNIFNSSYHFIMGDDGSLVETSNCPSIAGNSSATNTSLWIPNTIATTSVSSSYNVSAQKISISFTAPSGISNAIVDTIKIQGMNQSAASTDSNFPQATLDSAYVCRLVPTASISNYSTYTSCTATLSSGLFTITPASSTISGSTGYTTGWTVIIWGINGNSYTATTLPNTTYFTITTYKSSTMVDQSNTTNTSYGSWTLSTSNNVYFTVPTSTIGYQRNTVNARGWFRFDISFSQRTWFNTDKVVIDLDAVATTSLNANSSVVKCRITDTSDVIQQIFQSCTLSLTTTPPTVTIIAMPQSANVYAYDVALASSGVRVYLDNMVTIAQQSNKTVWGTITFLGSGSGSTTALSKLANTTDIAPANLTTTQAFATGYPTITKYWNNANDFQDFYFGLYASSPFNSSCRITIVFPSYYNPGLTVRSTTPYCTINGVYTQCSVGTVTSTGTVSLSQGLRSLVLWGSSQSMTNGTLLVHVNGISAPPANYTIETFWIQINGDNTESTSTIISASAVNDTAYSAPTTATLPLNVIWFGVSAATTRSFVTFTWSVYLNNATATVNTSSAVQVVFPESYGLAWGVFSPTCSVTDFTSSSTSYSSSSGVSSFGDIVNMNISTAIPAGAIFNVTCTNVRTGNNDGTYRSDDVQIRVVDANGTYVYYRAAPGQHNVNFTYAFAKSSSQTYISWATSTNATTAGALVAGTYSLMVTATVPSKSTRSFMITPSDSRFAFLSSTAPFWIVTGTTSNSTQIGCASSVPIGLYAMTFTISDNSSTYVAPPTMWIAVNTNAISISPSATTLSAYYSSSSLSSTAPLTFDLSAYPPYSDITITPVAPTGNTNFTFSPSSIKLTPAAPKNFFTFTSTSAATVAGSAAYTFTISGTNSASYTLSSSVTVSLTTDSGTGTVNTPVIAIAADSTDTSAATSKVISFTLSSVTQATIYWVVTLQGQSITDATAIWTNAAALTAYNMNSANQAQYATVYQSTTTKSATISNLFPNTGYTVSAVAVSNTNKTSTVATYTFVTGANSAVISRWIFNYTTYPSQTQRQTLLCQITQILAVPAINVRDVNGEICGNTTAFYSSSNSTGDIGIYFYPLQAAADTTMTASALQTSLNTTTVIGSLNTTLSAGTSGLGFYNTYIDIPTIKNAAPSLTLPTSLPSTVLTSASVYVSFTVTNDTGFAFIAVCSNSSTTTPTAVQIKQAAANISTLTGQVSVQVIYFYPGATVSYNFTGLSAATSYNVYLVASNNDPSFLQNFTSVTAVSVTTPSIGSTTGSPIGVIFSVMAVFASVISLMFF